MDISRHFPVLIVIVPFITAVLLPVLAAWKKGTTHLAASLAVLTSLAFTITLAVPLLQNGWLSYYPGTWEPPYGIEIKVDLLGVFMMLIITGIGLMAVVYSREYVRKELDPGKSVTYYSLILLLLGSMLGFSATGDIFNMFVFVEIMSITSYALVAVSGEAGAIKAAIKYLLMGAPSSILVLLAIGVLYSVTGTLNMADLSMKIAASAYTPVIIVVYGIFAIGFAVKAALFPLHLWLPDAHSIAPSPVSSLLSGLVVKMGIFGIIRITYSVYTVHFSPEVNAVAGLLSFIGVVAIVYGSAMALKQTDFKRMVAYATIAHVGYIVAGVGVIDRTVLTGSIFHILDHALAKACFFLVAGAIIYRTGYRKINELKGAGRKMPATCAAFAVAAFSAVGVPPSAGFFSKWYLVTGSLATGNYAIAIAVLLGSILAAGYCLRIVYYMFFLPPEKGLWEDVKGDVPLSMLIPTWVLSLSTVGFGLIAYLILPLIEKAVDILI